MLLAIITAFLAYKRAKGNGRNGLLWAVIGAAVFIAIQLAVSMGAGLAIGLGQVAFDWPDTIYDTLTPPITAVAIVLSFVGSWLLLRYLDRPVEAFDHVQAPPPPPSFGSGI